MASIDHNKEPLLPEPLLKVQGVSKRFGGLRALESVDLTVNHGEIVGLIGPNGAGKTTLFSVVSGYYRPTAGNVLFSGEDITGLKPHKICNRGIARTFQIPKPFLHLSVVENMLVGASFGAGHKNRQKAMEDVLEILHWSGLEDKAWMPADTLNLVQRKKLELSRAMSTAPQLILLDEVIAGLNPTEAAEMVSFITTLRQRNITVLIIEHIMKVIMNVSERIVVLDQGQKIREGLPEIVANDARVIEAYLGGQGHA
jgi:branched-chain amino acid transport system ATP-binding protein